nr:unnamed protein product [Spirometra erinaceieuropaei]
MLTLQLLRVMDRIWKDEGLNPHLTTYGSSQRHRWFLQNAQGDGVAYEAAVERFTNGCTLILPCHLRTGYS